MKMVVCGVVVRIDMQRAEQKTRKGRGVVCGGFIMNREMLQNMRRNCCAAIFLSATPATPAPASKRHQRGRRSHQYARFYDDSVLPAGQYDLRHFVNAGWDAFYQWRMPITVAWYLRGAATGRALFVHDCVGGRLRQRR